MLTLFKKPAASIRMADRLHLVGRLPLSGLTAWSAGWKDGEAGSRHSLDVLRSSVLSPVVGGRHGCVGSTHHHSRTTVNPLAISQSLAAVGISHNCRNNDSVPYCRNRLYIVNRKSFPIWTLLFIVSKNCFRRFSHLYLYLSNLIYTLIDLYRINLDSPIVIAIIKKLKEKTYHFL